MMDERWVGRERERERESERITDPRNEQKSNLKP
jgi:hypothetical protein